MGEQLMWRVSPSAEGVRRQLLALRDQWQLLKQTAASQSKALGGLRSLQDFNRKAERLEAWIRHKVWGVGSVVQGGGQPDCPPHLLTLSPVPGGEAFPGSPPAGKPRQDPAHPPHP